MDHTFAWVEFVLLTFLLLGYLLVYRHVTKTLQTFILLFTWNIGKIVIAFLLPYTTIFGYTVSITFLFILLIFNIFLFIYDQRSVLRSEEHTSELQSRGHLVCRLLLEKKK